jgi:hypothetical protein
MNLRRLRARIERLEARIPDPESEPTTEGPVNIEDDPLYRSILAWGRVADEAEERWQQEDRQRQAAAADASFKDEDEDPR